MKKILLTLIIAIFTTNIYSQVKVEGTVMDAKTGESIPYANVFFEGTTIGTVSDIDGKFYLEDDKTHPKLEVSFIGYTAKKFILKKGLQKNVIIALDSESEILSDVVFVASKKRAKRIKKKLDPAYKLLKKIWAKKQYNGLHSYKNYRYDKYEKLEFDINNIDSAMIKSKFFKGLEFIFDKIDTSRVTGKAFLPIFLNESIYKVYGKNNPNKVREDLVANKVSGFSDNQSVAQYTKNLYAEYNIYDNYIKLFNKSFVSPVSENGWGSYKYYIADSTDSDKGKAYKMIYFPRRKNELTFKGEFWVNAKTYAITKIAMDATNGINVNFIKDIYIEQEFEQKNDSTFLLKKDYILADIKLLTKKNDSKGMYAKKTVSYKNYKHDIDNEKENKFYDIKKDILGTDISNKSDEFWQENRHQKLNKNEEGIYKTLTRLKKTKKFKTYVNIVEILSSGFFNVKSLGLDIGNIYSFFGTNSVEGTRLKISARTYFSRDDTWRLSGYLAYGLKDQQFKYGISGSSLISTDPRVIVGAHHSRDIKQLGVQLTGNVLDNSFASSSIFSSGDNSKLSSVKTTGVYSSVEIAKNVNIGTSLSYSEIKSASKDFNIGFVNSDGDFISNLQNYKTGLSITLTPGKKTIGHGLSRSRVHSNYPTIRLGYNSGIITGPENSLHYQKASLQYVHPWLIGFAGRLITTLQASKTFGTVPLAMMDIPAGNQSYLLVPNTFALLDYYEFVTDRNVSLNLEHHFNGRVFSHIPLLKKLRLRSVIFARGLWGDFSPENEKLNLSNVIYKAPNKDIYYEYGFGIENIGLGNLRIFRVDFNWRGNYKTLTSRDFGVKVGISVKW